jgi:hypothetical protein
MANRIAVGIEAGGHPKLCMICPDTRTEPHDELFVVIVEYGTTYIRGGSATRLCREHLDELSILIIEALYDGPSNP